jgi:glycosyltransferase involved in cell wall biosynthesis
MRWRIGARRSRVVSVNQQIAVTLPPREIFSPFATGAVGMLARRLARAPSSFASVVIAQPGQEPYADVPLRSVCASWGMRSHAMRYATAVGNALGGIRPVLAEVHNRPDVALYLANRFPSLPVSLFLHNDPTGMRRARTPEDRAALLARLASVTGVSDWVRRRFLEGIARPAPVSVLPNCIDLSDTPVFLPAREPTILFAGRVVADKGADSFVRACAVALPQLPGWRAEILGADRFGPNSPETPFIRELRLEAAGAGVALPGWRPHTDVIEAMARAAIVVVPSRWQEPFGMTALEAMACGAALVCSLRGGLPEVVGDAAVPIDPNDPEGMAAAIVALALDPARRMALGQAGRARAAQFDVTYAAAALDTMRRNVLAAWPDRAGRPI